MGTLVWSPLAKGLLTGRIRKGQDTDLRRDEIPHELQRRAAPRRGREDHPARRGGRAADDAPRAGVRGLPPGRDERAPRPAHDGAAGRLARGRRRCARCPTTCSTGSTRSSRRARTSARRTSPPTCRRRCSPLPYAAAPPANAPRPEAAVDLSVIAAPPPAGRSQARPAPAGPPRSARSGRAARR